MKTLRTIFVYLILLIISTITLESAIELLKQAIDRQNDAVRSREIIHFKKVETR